MTKITWLGHATFEMRFDSGEVLVLDPWIEGNPAYPKDYKIERVDAIAVSHGHFDHINDVVPLAKKFNATIVAIVETSAWLEKKGVKNALSMNKGGTVDLGFVKLTMTHAVHSGGIKDGDQMIYGGEPAGYVLKTNRKVAYFAGDTTLFSDMTLIKELHEPELAMLPIGGHFTMDPHEAAHAARLLKVKRVIPMHYGTFPVLTGRPEDLAEKLKKDSIGVWTLTPAQPVDW